MTTPRGEARRPGRGERGALMVALMAGIAIMMILTAVAVQDWGDIVRRDNEAEMMFRAQDLVRGLKRFQKDKGRLPNDLKELAEPGQKGQYFVRKIWKDPLVKGGKWQLLYSGPQGGLIDPTVNTTDDGTGNGAGSGIGSPFGSGSATKTGDPNAPPGQIKPSTVAAGAELSVGAPEIKRNEDGSAEVSGLPIAGFKTRCKERPFRVYKDQTEYSMWVFSVFDLEVGQGAAPGAPEPGQNGRPGVQRPPAGANGAPGASLPPR